MPLLRLLMLFIISSATAARPSKTLAHFYVFLLHSPESFIPFFLSSSCLFTMAETFVVAAAVILPAHMTEKKKKGESKKKEKRKKRN
jgi:hypothetical protein